MTLRGSNHHNPWNCSASSCVGSSMQPLHGVEHGRCSMQHVQGLDQGRCGGSLLPLHGVGHSRSSPRLKDTNVINRLSPNITSIDVQKRHRLLSANDIISENKTYNSCHTNCCNSDIQGDRSLSIKTSNGSRNEGDRLSDISSCNDRVSETSFNSCNLSQTTEGIIETLVNNWDVCK